MNVVIVSSYGLPVTNIAPDVPSHDPGGQEMTVVDAFGLPVVLVESGGLPVTLLDDDGELWEEE